MEDPYDAFIDAGLARDGAGAGPLAGLTFAAKDLFDVAGTVSACGNPDWARTHDPATADAPVIARLLAAGASLRGKTHTDELAYAINGENPHYGTPVNPNAPGRIPGGSSSGSAAAVAGGLVDFALGTDTGGSVRIPASFCGLFGLRPTHGRIPLEGLMPLAPSFDTIGWFARDPALMRRVGEVLFASEADAPADEMAAADEAAAAAMPSAVWLPRDVWALCDDATRPILTAARAAIEAHLGAGEWLALAPGPAGLTPWFSPFRVAQGWEIHRTHMDWIAAHAPSFGPGVAERMAWTATITDGERDAAEATRAAVRGRFQELLADDALLVVPTVPGPAPERGRTPQELEAFRYRVLQMTGLASLTGNPQINLPLGRVDGLPVGLSLIAAHGRDGWLLRLAERLCAPARDGVAAVRPV